MQVTKIAEGVYGAIYSEMVEDPVQSNSLIIVGDDGVAVVDSHYTPSAAKATIAEIRKLTPLPVRFVITTHWHDDHIFGNQVYRDSFPGVQFVAQQATLESMAASAASHQATLVKSYANVVTALEQRLATGLDKEGKPITEANRANYTQMLPMYRRYLEDFKSVQVVLPTIAFDRELKLRLGSRELIVRSFGRANTPGDAVIHLPQEGIVAVGDLVVYPVPFIYGGFPASWVEVMTSVRALQPQVIVPGHGPVMRDFVYFDQVTALMQSLADQAKAAVARGLTLEEARKVIDLTEFRKAMAVGNESAEGTFDESIVVNGVRFAYDEAKAAAERPAKPAACNTRSD